MLLQTKPPNNMIQLMSSETSMRMRINGDQRDAPTSTTFSAQTVGQA